MLHQRKRIPSQLAFTLLTVLAIVLSACGAAATTVAPPTAVPATDAPPTAVPATEAPPTEGPTAVPEPVELHMTWWGSQTRHDRTAAVIELFQAQYPHITITSEFSSFGDYWTLLSTKVAAGELPDVLQQDYAYFKQYVSDGLLLPLDPYVDDGTIDLSNVPAEAVDGGRVDGQLYALSLGTNSQSFVIDVDKFEEAGVPLPKPDWTWKDFEETAMAIHDKLGIFGIAGGLDNPQLLNALFLSRGEGLYSDDGKALGFTDPQPLTDYFSMMVRLQDAGASVSREEGVANPSTLENNHLVSGEAAMYFAHTNQLVGLWGAAGEDRNLMMVPVPRAEGAVQSANYLKPSMFFSISANSEHPKEAAMLIDFFTNSVEANEILLAERGVPISTVVADAIKPDMSKAAAAPFDFLAEIEVSAIRPPDPAKHNEIQTNIYVPLVLDPLMFGQITPEEAAALFMEEANPVLASQ
jgi:multiple sugar transport system substrate-binding protein